MKIIDQIFPTGPSGHFPGERTFYFGLIKSISVMALGFSIVKFAFLMIQPGSLSACKMALVPSKSYAGDFGIALVAAGLYSTCHAYYQYCFREKQRGKIRLGSTPLPALFLTAVVLVLGLFLFSELMQSV